MVLLKNAKKLVIAGPCSVESPEQLRATALPLIQSGAVHIIRGGVWKPRTKPGGFEGCGAEALGWLSELQDETGVSVATEVATPRHVEQAIEAGIRVLWIGARTTGNPIIVQEIAEALRGAEGVSVMVKNPMHADLSLWIGAIERIAAVGITDLALIHRGFSTLGATKYRNLPLWNSAIEAKTVLGGDIPLLCDPSHICGQSDMVQAVTQQALNLCYDGLIIESHHSPQSALSDAQQQLTPAQLIEMLASLHWPAQTTTTQQTETQLEKLRAQIDNYDTELFELLARRMNTVQQIGQLKANQKIPILQNKRWQEIVRNYTENAPKIGLSINFVKQILGAIHTESIEQQNKIFCQNKQK